MIVSSVIGLRLQPTGAASIDAPEAARSLVPDLIGVRIVPVLMRPGDADRLADVLPRDQDDLRDSTSRPGPTWLIFVLDVLPFAARSITDLVGLPIQWGQAGYKLLLLVAPVYWRRRYGGRDWLATLWPIDEPRPSATTWLMGVASAAVLAGGAIFAILLLAGPFGIESAGLREQFDLRFKLTPARAAIAVVYLMTINAALEEL
ncbi:MAG: hypothetical protein WD176_09630, partial [Pirellulales bacterium]